MNSDQLSRGCARWSFRASQADAARLRHRQQETPSGYSFPTHSRILASSPANAARPANWPECWTPTAGSPRPRCVRQRGRGRQNSRNAGPEKLHRQGPRHRPAAVDYGKGRPANWRGIRHRDAALAADALQRREPARERGGAAACRAGSEPGGRRGRGAEGRLARTVVSAEDQYPHPGPQRRGGAGADAAPCLGRGPAGVLHPR